MNQYQDIIFVCMNNTYLSPMAEALYHQLAPEGMPTAVSRGLVVRVSEPISPKINLSLTKHQLLASFHENSRPLTRQDIHPGTLILTMTFREKIKLMEEFTSENVYTLGEFVEENTDIDDPYGEEEAQYEKCYHDMARRIHKVIDKLEDNSISSATAQEKENAGGKTNDSNRM
jgi:L-threonylcarbamoyladenylate synthase